MRRTMLQQRRLALGFQRLLQLVADVEVVLDRALAAAGHDDDSSQPDANASSTPYWMTGLSTSGIISFGIAFDAGRKRVPSPAAGKTALRTFFCRHDLLESLLSSCRLSVRRPSADSNEIRITTTDN